MRFAHFAHVWGKPGMTPHERYEQLWRDSRDKMSPAESMVVAISRFTVSQTAAQRIEERFVRRPRLVDRHQDFSAARC